MPQVLAALLYSETTKFHQQARITLTRFVNPLRLCLVLLALTTTALTAQTNKDDFASFNDFPLEQPLEYPPWFKKSFLDLQDDMAEALAANKKGLIVYFGQKRCAYCKMLMEVNLKLPDVVSYTRQHFDVVPIDIWGIDEITDLNGEQLSERDFAVRENANFTPALIFYDSEGNKALMLRGYYPPYKFRAALEYVADGHYRKESFAAYLERGSASMTFDPGELNEEAFFSPPPHNLDRSRIPGERVLVVFFEQGDCHACDVLHSQPLLDPAIERQFLNFDNVQLDIWSNQPLITPDGNRTSAREWARKLGIFYAPSLLFFDEQGREILRVDSVVHFYRLSNVLQYISSRAYLSEPNFMNWRHNNR